MFNSKRLSPARMILHKKITSINHDLYNQHPTAYIKNPIQDLQPTPPFPPQELNSLTTSSSHLTHHNQPLPIQHPKPKNIPTPPSPNQTFPRPQHQVHCPRTQSEENLPPTLHIADRSQRADQYYLLPTIPNPIHALCTHVQHQNISTLLSRGEVLGLIDFKEGERG